MFRFVARGMKSVASALLMTMGLVGSTSCATAEQVTAGPAALPQKSDVSSSAATPGAAKSSATNGAISQVAYQAPAADGDAVAKFEKTYATYQEVDGKLAAAARKYGATLDATERENARKTYLELLPQTEALLKDLRTTARDAFAQDPKHAAATKVLIGLASFDLRQDKFDAVITLANMMREKGCTDPVLACLAGVAAYQTDNYPIAETLLKEAELAGKLTPDAKMMLPTIAERKNLWIAEQEIRAREAAAMNLPRVELETTSGKIVLELFENEAPQAVANFVSLVNKKFYDGLSFHRVLPGFMAQGGDPKGDGTGGPGYNIYCECHQPNYRRHFRGSLSMAHAGRDTGGSQFFITFVPTTQLDGRHTCFGRVVEGFEALDNIKRRDPQSANPPEADKIISAKLIANPRNKTYEPTKVK